MHGESDLSHCTMTYRHQTRRSTVSKWKISLHILILLMLIGGISYRIIDWLLRYRSLSSTLYTLSDDDMETIAFPEITLCNLNPARGTAIFNMPNGSRLYDSVVDSFHQTGHKNGQALYKLPLQLFNKTGHRIEDMLKSCTVGVRNCNSRDFQVRLTPHGLCYSLNMKQIAKQVHLIFDPQEFDYLIPNEGYVGFRVLIHYPGNPPWAELPSAILLGPKFQTVVRVTANSRVFAPGCISTEQWENCVSKCENDITNCGCPELCMATRYHITSVTQALKSSFFARLLAIKNPDSFNRDESTVRLGIKIQQRAFLHTANRTAFNTLCRLAETLLAVSTDVRTVQALMTGINRTLSRDLHHVISLTGSRPRCLRGINSYFLELQRMVDDYDIARRRNRHPLIIGGGHDNYERSASPIVTNEETTMEAIQLYLVRLLFHGRSFDTPIGELLRVQLRLITRIQLKAASDASCNLPIVVNMARHYKQRLSGLGKRVTWSIQRLEKFSGQLLQLIANSGAIRASFPAPRGRLWRVPLSSLATVTVRLTGPTRPALKPVAVDKLLNPLNGISGIIFGSFGVAISLMVLVEVCDRNRTCSKSDDYRSSSHKFSSMQRQSLVKNNQNCEVETFTVL